MKYFRKLYKVYALLRHMFMGYGIPKNMDIAYVSGPMTGCHNFNFHTFRDASHTIRLGGTMVINPAESFGGDQALPRVVYLRLDTFLLTMCDEIVLLRGWQRSHGAQYELSVAREIGLKISDYDSLWVEKFEDL